MGKETLKDSELKPNVIRLRNIIKSRLQGEKCTLLADNLNHLSFMYIETIKKIADALGATPMGIGSTFNNFGQEIETSKNPDIDIALVPRENPKITAKKLEKFLCSLPEMPKRDHDTDVEAGRKYKAYDVYNNGRIALVVSVDKDNKPILGSIRLVDMNMKFPWTTVLDRKHITHKMEGNPTTKNPIVELGFPPYDTKLKRWLSPSEFNPTQKKVGVITKNDISFKECDHALIKELFPKLTQKSQAILAIRSVEAEPIQSLIGQINLKSFKDVVSDNYTFIYNLIPSIERISVYDLKKLLTNNIFMERIIKFTFPYIYRVLGMIDSTYNLEDIFEQTTRQYRVNNLLQLVSLAAQSAHVLGDPKSGKRREEASEIGKVIERSVFNYQDNLNAFDLIKDIEN
jgi:hypothetical protein